MSDVDASARPTPPYCSFATVTNLIERMEKEGVPRRIDKTYLVGMAGGTQNQVMAALRGLGLTTQENRSTDLLNLLANEPQERPTRWIAILQTRFPDLVQVATQNSTPGELNEVLAEYGFTGATTRKAATFLVAALTYAGIDVSPHLRPARTATAVAGTRRMKPQRRRAAAPLDATGDPDSAVPQSDMKRMYFDLLIEKARNNPEGSAVDGGLLDRIERLIGIGSEGRTEPRGGSES